MKKIAFAAAATAAFLSANVMAWGDEGHRAVGAIAARLIKGTNAEKQVASLLKPGETLESLTVWADCVKGSFCGPQTEEMQAFVAAFPKHNVFHYTDVPLQVDKYKDGAVGTAEEDIVQILKQCIAVLQGKDTEATNPHKFTKRQALIYVAHLTGDITQPLHVAGPFATKEGKFVMPAKHSDVDGVNLFESAGGNSFQMDDQKVIAMGAATIPELEGRKKEAPAKNLTKPFHSYWDVTVVDYAFRRIGAKTPDQFAEKIIDSKPTVAMATGDVSTWPYQWADDSIIAAKEAYADVKAMPGVAKQNRKGETYYNWSIEVPPNYPVPSSALAKTQLIKGGYNLAAVLKAVFPG